MKIAVDIDGTICWGNLPVFLDECNKTFHLGINQETLAKIENKQEFYALPEVQARRMQNAYIDRELAWIQFRETCLLSLLLMEDAVEGVARLAQLGDLAYYTVRYSEDATIQHEIEAATFQWLEQYHFINRHNVVFCPDDIQGKIQKMIDLARSDNVLLVDDNYQIIIKEIKRLKRAERNLLSDKLIIVAMHAEENELPSANVKMVALPYWDEIETMIGRIPEYVKTQSAKSANH